MLTPNVGHGHAVAGCGNASASAARASVPSAPPAKMAAISGRSILGTTARVISGSPLTTPPGITGMRWLRFLVFNALGAALWVGTWVSVGYLAGSHIGSIYSYITRYSYYALIVAGVVIVALIARHLLRRRRARPATRTGSRPRHHPE